MDTGTSMIFIFDFAGAIFNWVFDHFPIVATVLTFLLLAVWATWRSTRWLAGFMTRFKQVESDVGQLKENMVVVNKRLDGIDVKLKVMNSKFKRKFKVLDARFDNLEKRFDKLEEKFEKLEEKFDVLLAQLTFNNRKERQ